MLNYFQYIALNLANSLINQYKSCIMKSSIRILTVSCLIALSASLCSLTSCKKEEAEEPNTSNVPGTNTPPQVVDDISMFFDASGVQAQQLVYQGGNFFQWVYGTGGTGVRFLPNAFETLDGVAVTGDVDITMKEVYSKADMILSNIGTRGNSGLLASRGMFYIGVSQNGAPLRLKDGYTAWIRTPEVGMIAGIEYFQGPMEVDSSDFIWMPNPNITINQCGGDSLNPSPTYYCFNTDSLGWINCDYFYGANPKTGVTATPPSEYSSDNCEVFIVFQNENAVTSMGVYSNGSFTLGSSYQLPVGQPVTFVGIALKGGVYYSAFQAATIADNHIETLSFSETTLAEIDVAVNAL